MELKSAVSFTGSLRGHSDEFITRTGTGGGLRALRRKKSMRDAGEPEPTVAAASSSVAQHRPEFTTSGSSRSLTRHGSAGSGSASMAHTAPVAPHHLQGLKQYRSPATANRTLGYLQGTKASSTRASEVTPIKGRKAGAPAWRPGGAQLSARDKARRADVEASASAAAVRARSPSPRREGGKADKVGGGLAKGDSRGRQHRHGHSKHRSKHSGSGKSTATEAVVAAAAASSGGDGGAAKEGVRAVTVPAASEDKAAAPSSGADVGGDAGAGHDGKAGAADSKHRRHRSHSRDHSRSRRHRSRSASRSREPGSGRRRRGKQVRGEPSEATLFTAPVSATPPPVPEHAPFVGMAAVEPSPIRLSHDPAAASNGGAAGLTDSKAARSTRGRERLRRDSSALWAEIAAHPDPEPMPEAAPEEADGEGADAAHDGHHHRHGHGHHHHHGHHHDGRHSHGHSHSRSRSRSHGRHGQHGHHNGHSSSHSRDHSHGDGYASRDAADAELLSVSVAREAEATRGAIARRDQELVAVSAKVHEVATLLSRLLQVLAQPDSGMGAESNLATAQAASQVVQAAVGPPSPSGRDPVHSLVNDGFSSVEALLKSSDAELELLGEDRAEALRALEAEEDRMLMELRQRRVDEQHAAADAARAVRRHEHELDHVHDAGGPHHHHHHHHRQHHSGHSHSREHGHGHGHSPSHSHESPRRAPPAPPGRPHPPAAPPPGTASATSTATADSAVPPETAKRWDQYTESVALGGLASLRSADARVHALLDEIQAQQEAIRASPGRDHADALRRIGDMRVEVGALVAAEERIAAVEPDAARRRQVTAHLVHEDPRAVAEVAQLRAEIAELEGKLHRDPLGDTHQVLEHIIQKRRRVSVVTRTHEAAVAMRASGEVRD